MFSETVNAFFVVLSLVCDNVLKCKGKCNPPPFRLIYPSKVRLPFHINYGTLFCALLPVSPARETLKIGRKYAILERGKPTADAQCAPLHWAGTVY
jgi:hypothetical protein